MEVLDTEPALHPAANRVGSALETTVDVKWAHVIEVVGKGLCLEIGVRHGPCLR
jgi:hypothetical protein